MTKKSHRVISPWNNNKRGEIYIFRYYHLFTIDKILEVQIIEIHKLKCFIKPEERSRHILRGDDNHQLELPALVNR